MFSLQRADFNSGSSRPEEVRQHHVQAQLIPYEYVNKDSSCTFYRSLFWITAPFS